MHIYLIYYNYYAVHILVHLNTCGLLNVYKSHCCSNPYSLGSNMSSAFLLQRKAIMKVNAERTVPPINTPTCNQLTK